MRDEGKVVTVTGTVAPEQLGITLMHEHLLSTITRWFEHGPNPDFARGSFEPVTPANAHLLRQDPYHNRENCIQADWRLAANELRRFKLEGGRTMVDVTTIGNGRDIWGIRKVADDVGMNIIAGSGYYVEDTHPWDMPEKDEDAITAEIIHDIQVGADGTDIRCGIIGEIGTSDPIGDGEWRVLRASARAHLETGAAITVHFGHAQRTALPVLDVLIRECGVHPSRVIVDHIDLALDDWGYMSAVAETGAFLEYDHFGRSGAPEGIPSDADRIVAIERLAEEGLIGQLLISQDLGIPAHLAGVGGCGYSHILTVVVPQLLKRGMPIATIKEILIANPRRVLPLRLSIPQ
jgi:phosphotriesterase-related protein